MYKEQIYLAIKETLVSNSKLLDEDFINNYLDLRDSITFDTKWIEAYTSINEIVSINEEFQEIDRTFREKVYKTVAEISDSYELAAYISDDAGLIYSTLYYNLENEFIDYLYNCYKNRKLPN